MSIETLKLALEKIATVNAMDYEYQAWAREALAKQEQGEPDKYVMDIECTKCGAKQSGVLTVNTTPQQRTWVWLTKEDEQEIKDNCTTVACVLKAVKAKLRSKNESL